VEAGVVVTYHRIIGKISGYTCILIYTTVKVIIAYFMLNRPDTFDSVGVLKAGCILYL
jgi:hypothetical protein